MKTAAPDPKPLNVRQQKFCENVAGGMSATEAYILAGYKVSTKVAGANGSRLLEKAEVKAAIKELRARASERSEFKKDDLVRFLASAITTPVGSIDPSSPLCQEFTEEQTGTGKTVKTRRRVKSIGKIEAGRLLADLLGWKEPEKTEVDYGARTLDAIRERAREAASPLARPRR